MRLVVSLLPHAEFGPNDHREDVLHFSGLINEPLNLFFASTSLNINYIIIYFCIKHQIFNKENV